MEKWSDRRWSQEVKDRLCQLGKELRFTVRASGCRGSISDDGEWLYDLAWREEREGVLVDLPLVAESEWLKDDEINVDFAKLVQARAGLRLMVFQGRRDDNRRKHSQLLDQIRAFKGSRPDDSYLFAMFHWGTGELDGEFEFVTFVVPSD